jgi:hypothetical protein
VGGATFATDRPTFYVGGTQVHEKNLDHWAAGLAAAGLNTVAATVYAMQGDWDSDNLRFDESDPAVLAEIRAAKARGLTVSLTLRVAIDHAFPRNEFLWHGMIMPSSDTAIRSWFEGYTRFALQWARTCEREGVDLLAIGSELNELNETLPLDRWDELRNYYGFLWYQRSLRSRARRFADQIEARDLWVRGRDNYETLEGYTEARFETSVAWAEQAHLRSGGGTLRRLNRRRELINDLWIGLIARLRAVYGGRLTFAANFDSFDQLGFWSHLDLLGINAYFPLRPNLEAPRTVAGFTESWGAILDRIRAFREARGLGPMPTIFTELGYTFRRHSTVEPWAHGGFSVVGWKGHKQELVVWGEQPVDRSERAQALEGLLAASDRRPGELAGVLYWKLSTDAAHDAIEPFVLHIGAGSTDPALEALVQFATPAGETTGPRGSPRP